MGFWFNTNPSTVSSTSFNLRFRAMAAFDLQSLARKRMGSAGIGKIRTQVLEKDIEPDSKLALQARFESFR